MIYNITIIYHTAKFDNNVPGTIIGIQNPITMDSDTSYSSTVSNPSPTTIQSLSTASSSPSEAPGPDLFIYIIVAGTGIVALLFVVILLSVVLAYCCSVDKKRNR